MFIFLNWQPKARYNHLKSVSAIAPVFQEKVLNSYWHPKVSVALAACLTLPALQINLTPPPKVVQAEQLSKYGRLRPPGEVAVSNSVAFSETSSMSIFLMPAQHSLMISI